MILVSDNNYMFPDFIPYAQLGTTFLLGLALIWSIVQIVRVKKNGNGNGELKELKKTIDLIEGNHLSEIGAKLDRLIDQGKEAEADHKKMTEILIKINERLTNK